jgi:hypothetical protein
MRTEDIPETEGQGLYMLSFVESAGEVSPVFERKARNLLEDNGLVDMDRDEYYDMSNILQAFQDVVNEVGENTMRQGGQQMGEDVPWPPQVDGPHDALASVDEIYKQAHNFDGDFENETVAYTYERQGPSSARVGITDTYPYPDAMAEGAFPGFVKGAADGDPRVSMSETDPNADERCAWTVEW